MTYLIALASAVLITAAGLAMVASAWAPRGRHRSPFRPPVMLARPIDALYKVSALCSVEGRETQHAWMSITRQFICMGCHNPSRDPASYEEASS